MKKRVRLLSAAAAAALLLVLAAGGEAAGDEEAAGVDLSVTVTDAGTGDALPAVKVVVFVQETEDPHSINLQETWTDSRGIAGKNLEVAYRIAVQTEFSLRPREVAIRGNAAEIALSVPTSFPVRGRVVDSGGLPLAGAEVVLFGLQPRKGSVAAPPPLPAGAGGLEAFRQKFFNEIAAECRTDESGNFEARVGLLENMVAAAALEGFVTADWRSVEFGDGENAAVPVEIVLRRCAAVTVHFVNTAGRSLPGHAIWVRESPRSERNRRFRESIAVPFSARGKTDAGGAAVIEVPAGIDLVVGSGPRGRRALMFEPRADAPENRDFLREKPLPAVRLQPGTSRSVIATPPRNILLEWRVRDGAGNPLEGAGIRLPNRTVRTDAEGGAAFLQPFNAAESLRYAVACEGHVAAEGRISAPPEGQGTAVRLDVVLEKAGELVIDPGRDVTNVWLLAAAGGASGIGSPEGNLVAGAPRGGAWVFEVAGTDLVATLVQTGRFAFTRVDGIAPGAGRVELELDEAGPGAVLEGRVLAAMDSRPQLIRVVLMRNDLPGVRRFDPAGVRGGAMGWEAETAAGDGSFRFEGLAPGRYAAGASLFEWGRRTDIYGEVTVAPGDRSLSLEMKSSDGRGVLEITVTDASGAPLPDADILLLDPVDSPLAASAFMGAYFVTGDGGKVTISDLIPGRYGFVVTGEGHGAPVHGRALVAEGRRATVTVEVD